ncbi:capsular polysaccharide biosynthesis protein CapF [Anaerovorax odorimutans]|uniref:capsular polysaccharide biosynthesis protein CapF n=1 Tax=Anaerovorax odorimutans TaxID=109327 RepID=UPI0004114338|nr:capsular polysaccharide biosynthesis protein CapF [Anaerovorax odorimutans]
MKILITGAKGFIGKNLTLELRNRGYEDLFLCDIDTTYEQLNEYTKICDFVFHLAGVNRPEEQKEFMEGNFGFTSTLLDSLKKNKNHCPILMTSSIQAILDNPYGKSKKAGEDLLLAYEKDTGSKVLIYRLSNVFGKWCRPNYNSVVATFCNNIANDLPIKVNDREQSITLVYIDDVINTFISAIEGKEKSANDGLYYVITAYPVKLGAIADLIYSFHQSRKAASSEDQNISQLLYIPDMGDEFTKKLYSTYLSYLPKDKFSYPLKMNKDERGSFTEFLKSRERGQVSINISKPGITKGNHWHHTKNEKFLVVKGKGVVRFRKPFEDEIIEYEVSDEKLEIIDIPSGYTHNISNMGDSDMVTIMWANEAFNPDKPDTYYLEV